VTVEGTAELGGDDLVGATGITFGEGFAHAQDRQKAGLHRAGKLAAEDGVGFGETVAALGVSDKHGSHTYIYEHPDADLAREGSLGFGRAVLGTHGDGRSGFGADGIEVRERWEHRDLDPRVR
jgi:hypothetical protein